MFLLIQLDMKLVKNSSSFTTSYTGTRSEQNCWAVFVLPRLKLVCPGCTFRQQGRLGSTRWKHKVPKPEKMSFEERTPSALLHPCKKCSKWNSPKSHTHAPTLPPQGFVCYLLLVSLLNKWKCRNLFLKTNSAKIMIFFLFTSFQSLCFFFFCWWKWNYFGFLTEGKEKN